MNGRDWEAVDRLRPERLSAILKCSQQWDCRLGESHAIRHLNGQDLSACTWFELGRKHRISAWLKRGLDVIFRRPFKDFTNDDLHCIGMEGLGVILRERDELDRERRRLALVLPPVSLIPSGGCSNHNACVHVWHATWVNKISPEIVNPLSPIPSNQIITKMEGERYSGMHQSCRSTALEHIRSLPLGEMDGKYLSRARESLYASYNIVPEPL